MIPKIQACKTAEYVTEIMYRKTAEYEFEKIQACKTAELVSEIMAGKTVEYEFEYG